MQTLNPMRHYKRGYCTGEQDAIHDKNNHSPVFREPFTRIANTDENYAYD